MRYQGLRPVSITGHGNNERSDLFHRLRPEKTHIKPAGAEERAPELKWGRPSCTAAFVSERTFWGSHLGLCTQKSHLISTIAPVRPDHREFWETRLMFSQFHIVLQL